MKDQIPNFKNSEEAYSEALKSIAQGIELNPGFRTRLEKQLMDSHQPGRVSFFSSFHRAMPTLGWLAALAFMTQHYLQQFRGAYRTHGTVLKAAAQVADLWALAAMWGFCAAMTGWLALVLF